MDHADGLAPANVEKVTPAFGQWQPIETADHMSKMAVLVWASGYYRPVFALYYVLEEDAHPFWWEVGGKDDPLQPQPTHWMPLPKAPDSDDRTVIPTSA